MNLEEEIKNILFNIGKDIKIYTVGDEGEMIIDVDYEKYISEIMKTVNRYIFVKTKLKG